MILEPLLSIEQVAAILGISPWTLRRGKTTVYFDIEAVESKRSQTLTTG